ncbi:hypothetical protein N883_0209 [Listeria monocytogenes serotype 1/2a str. 01-5252]|nr:hypothetical protein N883_0209 [Listeria monocytogenes serotype 1/2a str. 01-5252]ASH83296.1 hypothetical protein N882_0209 [Listeria monocytogenes serotype 1/2a str. 01-1468]
MVLSCRAGFFVCPLTTKCNSLFFALSKRKELGFFKQERYSYNKSVSY